jgi:hypothetical protein
MRERVSDGRTRDKTFALRQQQENEQQENDSSWLVCKNMIAAHYDTSFIGKAAQDPHPLRPTKLMLTTCCNNSRKRGRPYTTNKDTIVNCRVLLFEHVPEVTIDQSWSVVP